MKAGSLIPGAIFFVILGALASAVWAVPAPEQCNASCESGIVFFGVLAFGSWLMAGLFLLKN